MVSGSSTIECGVPNEMFTKLDNLAIYWAPTFFRNENMSCSNYRIFFYKDVGESRAEVGSS